MPPQIPCANTSCRGYADKFGDLCAECKERASQQAAQAWKHKGWTRQEERDWLQHPHNNGKHKKESEK